MARGVQIAALTKQKRLGSLQYEVEGKLPGRYARER